MALQVARTLARISCTLYALFTIAGAVPNAAFPFNSQVPAVARVGQQYSFQISDSTFAPDPTAYVYTISNQPAWLTIDSSTRTLQGTPGASDAGSTTFVLTAADSSGNAQMSCTLVVSADPAPQPLGDIITKQLSATANLSSSQPPTLTLLPSTRFTFDFGQDSFIDVLQRKLYYYATLNDHTPLPSWMKFDPDLLTFSGTAPDLASFPQSWVISLIASDVPGFSANSASFTMTIGTQQLVFVPEEQELSITAGKLVNVTVLQNELFRNNVNLDSGELKSAEADIPSWLTFDPATLAIEGTAPANFQAENVTITVTDKLGNAATAIITLVPGDSSMFHGQIGTLSAQAGKKFEYHFDDSLFTRKDLDLSVHVPSTASWLTYDATTQDLTGTPPTKSQASTVRATLVAKSASDQQGQAQSFIIRIKAATTVSIASKIPPGPTSTSTPSPVAYETRGSNGPRISGGMIAAIVILSILGAILLLLTLFWCCRRKRRHDSYVEKSPRTKTISRPIQAPQGDDTVVVTTIDQDVEKDAGLDRVDSHLEPPTPLRAFDPPPQIVLDGIPERRSRFLKRFSRISQASSLGMGEEAIRGDENIPEWGTEPTPLHTPHDSFSVPTEMARRSTQWSDGSPSKRAHALQKMRAHGRHHSNVSFKRLSVGLGIGAAAGNSATPAGVAHHSSRNGRGRNRKTKSILGLPTTRETSVGGSLRTTRTSILSTTPSDFPEPGPSRYSNPISPPMLSTIAASMTLDPKRKSIRMVGRSDSIRAPGDDSRPDNRPLDKKRESFIRNRHRSGHMQSPLFSSHGSRSGSTSLQRNGSQSIEASLAGSVRRAKRGTPSGWGSKSALPSQNTLLTKYSESSSLEPHGHMDSPHRDSRRFSQRLRNTFVPGFPRAITRSTLFDNHDDDRIDEDDGDSPRHSNHHHHHHHHHTNNSSIWTTSASNNTSPSDGWLVEELSKPRAERDWVLPDESSPIVLTAAPPPSLAPTSRASTPLEGVEIVKSGQNWRRSRRRSRAEEREISTSSPLSQPLHPHPHPPLQSINASSAIPADTTAGSERDKRKQEQNQRQGYSLWVTDGESESESDEEEDEQEKFQGAGLIPPLGGSYHDDGSERSTGKGDTARSDWTGRAFL